MPREHDRRHPPDRIPLLAGAVLGGLLVLAVPAWAQQEKCACKHLDAIRKDQQERITMREYYRRLMEKETAQELEVLRTTDDDSERERRFREIREEDDRRIQADTTTIVPFQSEGCEPDPDFLRRAKAAAPCVEAGDATEQHEHYHHDVCVMRKSRSGTPRRTTWPIDIGIVAAMSIHAPSGDRAEEVAAYSLEIAELQKLIDRLSADLRFELSLKSVARMDWRVPMGPVGNAAEYGSTARIPLEVEDGPAPQRVTGRAPRIFEARVIGGVCQYTGMPLRIPMALDGTLEDGRFKLKIDKDGQQIPPFGVACPFGAGMALPSPAPPPPVPPSLDIEARDGARFVYDYSTGAAAMMTAAVGRLSGDAVLTIEAVCKPDP